MNPCPHCHGSGQVPDMRAARESANLTQVAASQQLKVNKVYLSDMERGLRPWPTPLFHRALELYKVPWPAPKSEPDDGYGGTLARKAKEGIAREQKPETPSGGSYPTLPPFNYTRPHHD